MSDELGYTLLYHHKQKRQLPIITTSIDLMPIMNGLINEANPRRIGCRVDELTNQLNTAFMHTYAVTQDCVTLY